MSGRGRSGSGGRGRGRGGGGGGRGGSSSGGKGRGGGGGGGPSTSAGSGRGGPPPSSSQSSGGGGRGRGGGGRGGRGSRRNRGRGGKVDAEQDRKRKEEEAARQQKEEADAKLAAEKAAAEQQRKDEIARREKLQSDYESSIKAGIATLDAATNAVNLHAQLRGQLDPHKPGGAAASPLDTAREAFEASKKKLKSDLKKCTAFVKKVKSGAYPTQKELEGASHPIKTLNLTRYVEEVAAALLEPSGKVKQADVPGMALLCVEMHRRYPAFAPSLVPTLLATVNGKTDAGDGLSRRICFRLLTEFVLHGVLADVKPVARIMHEAAGPPGEEGREYQVTDANLIVTFAKAGGTEILGVVPRSFKGEVERLKREAEGRGEGSLVLVAEAAAPAEASAEASAEQKAEGASGDAKAPEVALDTPFTPTLSDDLREKCQAAIESFTATVPAARAVGPTPTSNLHKHCTGAYRTLSTSYAATHRRLLKMEKRAENDRLLQGTLSEAREKGLADARSLLESLKKSVEGLSEALDVDVPVLDEEEAEDAVEDGKGIQLWTKGENADGDADLGPFDDDATRSFYCDVPDLLTTKPPALLGIGEKELEEMKERNLQKYGGDGEDEEGDEGEGELATVDETGEEGSQKEDAEMEDAEDKDEGEKDAEMEEIATGEKDDAEMKDTPHYRLMVLLEEELPEASRRDTIDDLADRFCVNHGSNRKSRKRLYETLFLVPRSRLDLLPYYARFACTVDKVYPDSTLVQELEQQFHGQARFKKNQNLEARMRTARYLGELTKFRVAPPMVVLRGIRRCLEDFSGYNIDVACCLLESCGRYLYRLKHTHQRLSDLMDTMMRIKKARNLEERHIAMITSAFLMVNPPAQTGRPQKEVPPLEAYLRYLLLTKLEADDKSVRFASKQIQRMPWSDPGLDCGALVCKYMLKACRRGRYKATRAIASVAADLKRNRPEVPARLIDDVLEEIEWFMEHPNFRDHQRTLVCARLLGELYCAGVIPSSILLELVHHVLNFGHDIPDALRKASVESQELFAPRGNISQTIQEDEELEEEEGDEEEKEEEDKRPQVVSVSPFSKYDPRVPCEIDPPMSAFRIKLACTILETASRTIVTAGNKTKLDFTLASLQRYLFTKTSLPSDVEFSVLDLFDALDSGLKKVSSGGRTKKATSFVRYNTWLEAQEFVVAAEKAKTLDEARVKVRGLAQAGLLGADDASISDGDLLDEDGDTVEMSDDDESVDKESIEAESDDESDDESVAEVAEDHGSESGGSDDDEEMSDEEEGDEIDEAAAEAAYLRQLQDEEFESELRKLTMEALEKGKVTSRSAGGKVSSQMIAAPEFMAKKPASGPSHAYAEGESGESPFGGEGGVAFKLYKRGNRGKQEEVELFVPKSTNLAQRANRQDDEAAKERDLLKAQILRYEEEARDAGGNLYIDEQKLEKIHNKKLTMDVLDKNFGKSRAEAPHKPRSVPPRRPGPGRGSERGRGPGRGRGGGRLFNPGRG